MQRIPSAITGFLVGLVLLPILLYLYLAFGRPPVATADKPFPLEEKIVAIPLNARIQREAPVASPVPVNDATLDAGAGIYEDKCEECHGVADAPSAIGRAMFPQAPQFWAKGKSAAMKVDDDPVGETYWKVKNGIRLTGMPAYTKALSETQLWQVSLLLSMADKPLPADAAKTVGQ
jgi:thiosulfate dehydrogenase